MKQILFACLAMIFAVIPARATDVDGNAYVLGSQGIASCKEVTAKIKAKDEAYIRELMIWVTGYVTGSNRALPQTYNILGAVKPRELLVLVRDYCAAHPKEQLESAVFVTLKALFEDRQTKRPG